MQRELKLESQSEVSLPYAAFLLMTGSYSRTCFHFEISICSQNAERHKRRLVRGIV